MALRPHPKKSGTVFISPALDEPPVLKGGSAFVVPWRFSTSKEMRHTLR
jgi:hypothetical protein